MPESNINIQSKTKLRINFSREMFFDRETGDIAKWLNFVFWPSIIALTILFLWLAASTSRHLAANDSLYYLSVAENLLNNGLFLDGTLEPSGPIVTPQNAIVVVYYLLMKMSLTNSQCLMAVTLMNYFLMLLTIYPIIKIAARIGITDRFSTYILITAYLGSLNIFNQVLIAPTNDMFFLAGSLFLTYFLVNLYDQIYSDRKLSKLLNAAYLSSSIILSMVLIHFRINALFIPLAAIGASLLTRRFRILPIATILLILMCLSIFSVYAFVNTTEYESVHYHFDRFLSDIPDMVHTLLFKCVPESLFKDLSGSGNLLYLPFYLAMMIALVRGIARRDFLLLMILFTSIMLFLLTLLIGCVSSRYLSAVIPFMYMMILSVKRFHTITFLFVAAILLNSLWMIFNGIKPTSRDTFWSHVSSKFEFEKGDTIIAYEGRRCWYYTGSGTLYNRNYTWQQIQNTDELYLAGRSIFLSEHSEKIKNLATQNEHEAIIKHLTPEYTDYEGNGLYLIHFESNGLNE